MAITKRLSALPESLSLDFFGNKALTKRGKERGYNYFLQGYVHDVDFDISNQDETVVSGRCYRSMRKNESPHKLRLCISDKERKFTESNCSCVAGLSGTCSHVIGLVYVLIHYQHQGLQEIPAQLSSTSLPQQWHKPRGAKIRPQPVFTMVFAKAKDEAKRKRKPVLSRVKKNRVLVPTAEQVTKLKSLKGTPLCYLLEDKSPEAETVLGPVQKTSSLFFQTTKEQIVIKQCIMELNAKNKARWRDEIAGLKSSKHENLVSAREIPIAIARYLQGPEPCLGLEFCEGGDLRKVLNYPDHCVGLKEKTVLAVLHDVSNGIVFLHQHKIIHRDIKPENILISYIGDKVVYKITDLGYAKQLDQTSLCTSFVGTLHYIAPEMYTTEAYTVAADFWSFGTMIFECITGKRPFEFHEHFLQWHQLISRKGNKDICGEVLPSGNEVVFHSTLPEPNRLSRPLIEYFETWLQLVLRWNPSERGGVKDAYGVRECTRLIRQILQTKMVHVFCISNGSMTSFKINDTLRVAKLQSYIDKEYDISPQSQELLLPTGTTLNPSELVISYAKEMENTEQLVFLINKQAVSTAVPLFVPDIVQDMVGSPELLRNFETTKRMWGHSLYFCIETAQTYKRMLQGQRALLIKLVNCNFVVAQSKETLFAEEQLLSANRTMLEKSCEYDLNKFCEYELQNRPSVEWVKHDLENLLGKVRQFTWGSGFDVKDEVRREQERLVAIRKNPLCGKNESELDKSANIVRAMYENHRRLDKEAKLRPRGSQEMAAKVLQVIQTFEILHKDLAQHFRNIWSCASGIETLIRSIKGRVADIKHAQHQIQEWMEYKQNIIWKFAMRPVTSRTQSSSDSNGSMASSIAYIINNSQGRRMSDYDSLSMLEGLKHGQDRIRYKMEEIRLRIESGEEMLGRPKANSLPERMEPSSAAESGYASLPRASAQWK